MVPPHARSDSFSSDLTKTGGHALHAFVKADVPLTGSDPRFLMFGSVLNKLGLSVASFRSSLGHSPADNGMTSAAQIRRLQAPSKLLQAAAFACKRADLIQADRPEDNWLGRTVAEEAQVASHKPADHEDYWKDAEKLSTLHQYLLRLAVAAAKLADAAKGSNDTKQFSPEDLPAKE